MAEETLNEETIENPPEEETSEEKTKEELTSEKATETAEELKSQRDRLYARLKKEEEKTKVLEGKVKDSESSKPTEYNLTLESIKIGKKLEKYSDDEIDSVANIIKSNDPQDILKALDNSYIKQGIEIERAKVAEKNKIPGSSPSGLSASEEKTPEEIAGMSREEHRKYFEKMKKLEASQGI